MTKLIILLLLTFCATALAGYADSSSGNFVSGNGQSGGYGYGYSGGVPPGFPQQFFQHIPFDFNSLLAGYVLVFSTTLVLVITNSSCSSVSTRAIAYTSVSIDPPFRGNVFARSRIIFDGLNQIQQQVQRGAGTYGFPGGYQGGNGGAYAGSYSGHGGGGNFGAGGSYPPQNAGGYNQLGGGSYNQQGGGSYNQHGGYGQKDGGGGGYTSGQYAPAGGYQAGASAHVGGGQVQQSAYLNPENQQYPNVNVRFAGVPQGGGQFSSVYTSSSSGSGNVNGKPVHFRHAETTVNDNGKISTYSVHDKK